MSSELASDLYRRLASFQETPENLLLVANGMAPWLRWDGLTDTTEAAGVLPPASACTLDGEGEGAIVGTYAAFVRFVDNFDNLSNLSPLSNTFLPGNSTGSITNVTTATPMVVTSAGHGLTTGAVVKITGVGGTYSANDTWSITVSDPDTFSLDGSSETGTYSGGGTWVSGVDHLVYTNVPVPVESKVVRRQILRNTDGQFSTLYVDIDTGDTTTTTLTSSLTDAQLAAQTPAPLFDANGNSLVNVHDVPPAHKSVLAHHLGRMFAAVDVPYEEGCVAVTLNSTSVQGIGTEWTSSLVGRLLYVSSADRSYQIADVDTTNQILTLEDAYATSSDPYSVYSIRPAPAERRLIYYSEAGLSESWPPINALALQEDGDEITGLMVNASFLYILEKHHVYRFTFQTDPSIDGYIFQSTRSRGCINNRCWVPMEGSVYMLDEQGVHAFDGGEDSQPISQPIQDIFRKGDGNYSINWSAARYFHAVAFPAQETIRWFVALAGHYLPRHALVYHYRLQRWWIEEFSFPIGASLTAEYQGELLNFLGSTSHRILAYWTNTLEGPSFQTGTLRGTISSITLTTLTDAGANFVPGNVVGFPVTIVDGTGKDQTRLIVAASGTTLTLSQPWLTLPDITSVYQVGAVNWRYRTPWFRFIQDEQNNPRRLELIWEPTRNPATMRLRVTYDTDTDPVEWESAYTSPDHNGLRVDSGSPDLTVDLTKVSGFVQQRLDYKREYNADAPRWLFVEMLGSQGRDPLIIDQLTVDGVG